MFSILNRRLGASCFLLFLALLVTPASAYHPNQPQGFGPERSFHQVPALPDQVDLFSGRLSVTFPLGPFTLIYNNNVWRYSEVVENNQLEIRAEPDRLQNAGLGWHLGLGELYPPSHWYNDSPAHQWLYVGADGSRHTFYGALHRNEDDGDLDVYYTRDNSYLRLKKIVAGSAWDIEFPDGTTRRFVKGGAGTPYRLTKVWDRFGSASDPDLTITYSADDKLRTVTDRHGRQHFIHLAGDQDLVGGHELSWMTRVITRVDVQGVGGQRSVYDFTYRNILVNVSCKNTSSQIGPRIRLPHLARIDLPDGTAYVMEEAGTPSYVNSCPAGIDDAPGSLTRMELPTGGVLRWTYQEYEFPPGHNWGPFNTSAGVATREAVELDGTVLGSWNYVTRDFGGTSTNDPEVWTDVVALPEGDCTRHYFSAIDYVQPSQGKGWEYGLPFVRSVESTAKPGRYLSTEVYTGHDGSNMLCSGTKLRSTYVWFRRDPTPGVATQPNDPGCTSTSPCSRLDEWYNTNRALKTIHTVFHDDGDRWIDVNLGEFDGIGNFRRSISTGNLWSGSANDEQREIFTHFTRSPGTFPNGGYTHPSPSEPWILRVYDRVDTTELDAHGETTSRVETVFDDTTGVLECTRTLRSGTSRTRDDVVVTYDYDFRGNVTDVKRYGGDARRLPSVNGAGCGDLSSQPTYWDRHEYDFDELARTRPYHADGTPGDFLTYDVTIDPLSGVPIASRDTAGYQVDYGFDAAGRLTTITPQDGASVAFTYTNPSGTTGATVHTTTASGAVIFREEEQVLDSFGRVTETRRTMANGTWVNRQFRHNARGWLLHTTEWNYPGTKTQLLGHDPFGRPTKIRPPEGSHHDVLLSYSGIRQTTRSAPVQTTLGAPEVYFNRTREFDRYGRLRKVIEPAGASGSDVITDYLYDIGNRLTRITTGQGSLQQVRAFTYENNGFLLSESHPEMGATGNGTVSYTGYDAAGIYRRMVGQDRELRFAYDYAGRLRSVWDQPNDTLLRSYGYDSGTGLGLGKLYWAKAFNYLKVPATGQTFQVDITQRFDFEGVAGSISEKETYFILPSGLIKTRTTYQRDDGGNVTSIDYPSCFSSNCVSTAMGTSPQIDLQYTRGWLKSIPGWVNAFYYHSSGLWKQINRTNWVSDVQEVDPDDRDRPRRIYMTGAQSYNWDSGLMTYDGSGNITAMGQDVFVYDGASRVTGSQQYWQSAGQQYSYDVFGNLLTRSGVGWPTSFPVDSQTNRLTTATYDGAGNVLTWNGHTFAYDLFNRLINQAWMTYAYDAFGERAASFASSSTAASLHVRGLDHELLSTLYFDGVDGYSRVKDFVYANGRVLGVLEGMQTHHYHTDHLGTQKLVTTSTGSVDSEPWMLPYGREYWDNTSDNRLFTGHERDWSADTDYMHARHYSWEMGRFLSVDSFRGLPEEPQSLNRYAYVMGNPVSRWDPDGRQPATVFHDDITVTAEPIPIEDGLGGGGTTYIFPPGFWDDLGRSADPFGFGRWRGGPRIDLLPEANDTPTVDELPEISPLEPILQIDPKDFEAKPPCHYVSAPEFDRWRYGGTRFLEQTELASSFRPFGGALTGFAFLRGRSIFLPWLSRAGWVQLSRANIARRSASAGFTAGRNVSGGGGSSAPPAPEWCDP